MIPDTLPPEPATLQGAPVDAVRAGHAVDAVTTAVSEAREALARVEALAVACARALDQGAQ